VASENPDEQALRALARAKLDRGDLPTQREMRLWAGPGANLPCALCERPIARGDVEYELQFPAGHALKVWHLHRVCYAVWELERLWPSS
jgi:hypothetical protein